MTSSDGSCTKRPGEVARLRAVALSGAPRRTNIFAGRYSPHTTGEFGFNSARR